MGTIFREKQPSNIVTRFDFVLPGILSLAKNRAGMAAQIGMTMLLC